MKWYHIFLYVIALSWNLTVCWPAVLLVRLLWGENLRWEQNPDPEIGDGPSLWCDLKPDSWPTRSWYRHKRDGEHREIPEEYRDRYGRWVTWGGTTIGHGGFYGPGRVSEGSWSSIQQHEHTHVESFEAAMLTGFFYALGVSILLGALAHPLIAAVAALVCWWAGWPLTGISNWFTALLRGEHGYYGSIHEELAYFEGDEYKREHQ